MLKKRIAAFVCTFAAAVGCVFNSPAGRFMLTAEAAGSVAVLSGGTQSDNRADTSFQTYDNQDKRVRSYMYESSVGVVTRVEFVSSRLVVEEFNMKTGTLKSHKDIALPDQNSIFGGFFAGEKYNFLVTGKANSGQDNNAEVFRVTRFSKDFNSYSSKLLNGRNTVEPFKAGSCRMTETGGKLYIHTCHLMYADDYGVNHQANMSYVLDEELMTFVQERYEVGNPSSIGARNDAFGYSSHSFDQFIISDDSAVYAYDHGDAAPRALRLHKYTTSDGKLCYTDLVSINGAKGDNYTSVLTGDMEMSDDRILVGIRSAGITDGKIVLDSSTDLKDIYILSVAKGDIGNKNVAKIVKISEYEDSQRKIGMKISAPRMTKLNNDLFLVMWTEIDQSSRTMIAFVDKEGNRIGDIKSSNRIVLSDCDPILCSDGKVRWYTCSGNKDPVLYALDPNDPESFDSGSVVSVPGDANGDGEVSGADCSIIQKYLLHWIVDIDLVAADVTGDGKVNGQDVARIQQKLAGWNVVLL